MFNSRARSPTINLKDTGIFIFYLYRRKNALVGIVHLLQDCKRREARAHLLHKPTSRPVSQCSLNPRLFEISGKIAPRRVFLYMLQNEPNERHFLLYILKKEVFRSGHELVVQEVSYFQHLQQLLQTVHIVGDDSVCGLVHDTQNLKQQERRQQYHRLPSHSPFLFTALFLSISRRSPSC